MANTINANIGNYEYLDNLRTSAQNEILYIIGNRKTNMIKLVNILGDGK